MNRPLKQSAREHFESYSLSSEQLQQLEALGRSTEAKPPARARIYRWTAAAAVAAFALAFALSTLMNQPEDMLQRIAIEVATNHVKLKPMEIETQSIDDVRDYFNKLDFIPVNSAVVSNLELELTGGRYCSLQGIGAAQLRVKQPGSGTVQSLYQADYDKDVFNDIPVLEHGDEPAERYAKGIKVRIWAEKGLVFALTELP